MRRLALLALALTWAPAAAAAPPVVSVQASKRSGPAPLTVTLSASGNAASYHWNFGDGQAAGGPVVQHTYPAGAHVATLTATAATGEAAQVRVRLTAFSVVLADDRRRIQHGARTRFRGKVVPAHRVRIRLYRGKQTLATAVTRRSGRFRLAAKVVRPGEYRVGFRDVTSKPVRVVVRPSLDTALARAQVVGGRLTLRARLRPSGAGRIRVSVVRGGRTVLGKTYARSVRVRLRATRSAVYRVRISTTPRRGYASVGRTLETTVHPVRLGLGARGASVRLLEERLASLRYVLAGVGGTYGVDTRDAVLAFQKVHGLPRTGQMDRHGWRVLARARTPRARVPRGNHIEVDKARQLLLEVRGGRVVSVVHVSTGATGNTPLGWWRVYRKATGWDGVLWYPMYFLRGFAIHGYPSVPTYPASHGCVRLPMWVAARLYARHAHGSTVYVY